MRFILAWIRILAALLLFGLLANYLYFAFMKDSSVASGWALGLLLTAFLLCVFFYIWGWNLARKMQKSPLDAYIEDVHKEEELVQQMTPPAPLTNADEVAAVLEKLVAANAKNTTTLNLAMENLNSRLDELEEKFIRRETAKENPQENLKEYVEIDMDKLLKDMDNSK